jgi:peptidoglycan hydrolase CwlO-like protein
MNNNDIPNDIPATINQQFAEINKSISELTKLVQNIQHDIQDIKKSVVKKIEEEDEVKFRKHVMEGKRLLHEQTYK